MEYPFSDLGLARTLERTEARSNAAFVEARARLYPSSGACWCEVAGAYAMFDGVGSPITQTFGLGLFDPVGAAELERLEHFFAERGAQAFHEVSPMAPPALLGVLGERGYRPVELTSVLYRPIARDAGLDRRVNPRMRVRRVDVAEAGLWAEVAAEGWSTEAPELPAFMREFGAIMVHAERAHCFVAEFEGRNVAAGALRLEDRVALLGGASTIPSARGQGAQLALLAARMKYAVEQGAELAMMAAAPGSASQRNAERQGFRIGYTRIKWESGKG